MLKKIPAVADKPYMIVKPNQNAAEYKYYKTFAQARAAIVKDIEWFTEVWQGLNIQDSVTACVLLKEEAANLNSPGSVAGIIDPYSGIKYAAEIVQRAEL